MTKQSTGSGMGRSNLIKRSTTALRDTQLNAKTNGNAGSYILEAARKFRGFRYQPRVISCNNMLVNVLSKEHVVRY